MLLKNGPAAAVAAAPGGGGLDGGGAAKQKKKKLLPLAAKDYAGATGSVLVAGPVADNGNNTFGNYACNPGNCTTPVTTIFGGLQHAGTGLTNGEVGVKRPPPPPPQQQQQL
eukprot:SAG22_NODE_914_length_6519_cov_1.701713_7_plen_112_part_00